MTSAQRWGWALLTTLITLSIIFLFVLEADATGYCGDHERGGHKQCGTTTTTSTVPQESSTTIQETTTTVDDQPTTTLTDTSTTTVVTSSSTTTSVSTTTVPTESTTTEPLLTLWTAAAVCQTIHADFGTGIVQIDVYQRLPEGDFGPADGVVPITESGQVLDVSAAFPDSEWLLVPVVETGWTAIPDQISLFTAHCSPHPSTTPPTEPTPPELPRTGAATQALVAVAAALSVLGFMLVKEAGHE